MERPPLYRKYTLPVRTRTTEVSHGTDKKAMCIHGKHTDSPCVSLSHSLARCAACMCAWWWWEKHDHDVCIPVSVQQTALFQCSTLHTYIFITIRMLGERAKRFTTTLYYDAHRL